MHIPVRVGRFIALTSLVCAGCSRTPAPEEAVSAGTLAPFRALPSPAAVGGDQPRLSLDSGGRPVLSWIEQADDGESRLLYARLDGERWLEPSVAARGRDWVISAADLPSVRELAPRLWAADWRVTSEVSPYAYDIRVAVSADDGEHWSDSLLLNDDATPTEHGFVSWFASNRRIGAVWLDGRDAASEELESAAGEPLGTSLRYAYLDAEGAVEQQGIIDALVCDCCRTDVTQTARGSAVVYRDRSASEIRDIAVRVSAPGGWSEAVTLGPDGWEIEGCPINGPALDAVGDEVVAAWFTAADGRARVRAARSSDGGESFAGAVDVDGDDPVGQVGAALGRDGTAYVSWWRRGREGGAELVVRSLGPKGELGSTVVVTHVNASRPDSVPQLERSGDRLVVAWTDDTGETAAIRIAYAQL